MTRIKHLLIFLIMAASITRVFSQIYTQPGINSSTGLTTNSLASGTDQMRALKQQVDDALAAYEATNDVSGRLWDVYRQVNDTNLPKIFELAKQKPGSEASFEMFAWILTNRRVSVPPLRTYGSQALEFLGKYHSQNPGIGGICHKLGTTWSPIDPAAMDFLKMASENNPDRCMRGNAVFALGEITKRQAESLAFWEGALSLTNSWSKQDNATFQKEIEETDLKTLFLAAQKAYETVLTSYANCPMISGSGLNQSKTTLGDGAKIELFELNHLMPGRAVPEISGQDIDGRPLSLSQYRGRVVVLSFWATWCGPCMQMIPLERALTERFKHQPFALIGVNGDSAIKNVKFAVQKENVTWPSFQNQIGHEPAIADIWNVKVWPTVYVIDADGIVRLKFSGYAGSYTSKMLNAEVCQLLNKMPDSKTN